MDSLMDVDNEKDDTKDAPQSLGSFLSQGLKQMYLDQQFCDATLVVEGRRFPCHGFFVKNISMENCIGIYALAYAHNHKDLLHAAMHHIGLNFGSIS
ncbi:uncharacterized protein LOC120381021 isoform X2 [Mauremys reevesii]|uniref:uncharacterized protein LOC120381021 isoform X2 n=1 Tax=Mauremys reevesii TaxID=260615 RepID=UPI00193F3AAF|nr:uncharacterized protein LOC120381021 isoform X2 [Mauremys reevesii]